MTVLVAMLRAVNLGPHNRLKMEELRALCAKLKLHDVQTYVQSGNLVFRANERERKILGERIQNGILKEFGFRPEIVLRTAAEMRTVVAGNPFAKRREIDARKLLVWFLTTKISKAVRDDVGRLRTAPEEIIVGRRELYIYFPNGMARPKMSWAALEKALHEPGTGRNWTSVTKMLEMAERLDAASS